MTRMMKGVTAALLLAGGILLSVPGIKAATCSGGGATCTGECCWADANGCSAGPCPKLPPVEIVEQ